MGTASRSHDMSSRRRVRYESSSSLLQQSSCLHLSILAICFLLHLLSPSSVLSGVDAYQPPLSVSLVDRNSSSLSLTVSLPNEPGATVLEMLLEPESGNATKLSYPTDGLPLMNVKLTELQPDTLYTLTFRLTDEQRTNVSEPIQPTDGALRTFCLGPEIIGFFASDPNDDSPADRGFSVGDVLTLTFDADTNTPGPLRNKNEVARLLTFSAPLGESYFGQWRDGKTLEIVIEDPGLSSPTLGYLTAKLNGPVSEDKPYMELRAADGFSDVSTSSSPPLIGSFAAHGSDGSKYFRIIAVDAQGKPTTDPPTIVPNPGVEWYTIRTEINKPAEFSRLALYFPDDELDQVQYELVANILYPSDGDKLGFLLDGRNFSYAPGTNIGTSSNGRFTNEFLAQILPTVKLFPKPDTKGWACVQFQLFDRKRLDRAKEETYLNVKIDTPAKVYVPKLTVNGVESNESKDPISVIKSHQTELIIALCCVFGSFILIALSCFAAKRLKRSREAREFYGEGSQLKDESDHARGIDADDNGPSRRFYYDANV